MRVNCDSPLDSLPVVQETDEAAKSLTAARVLVTVGVRLRKGGIPHIGGFLVKFLRKET